MVTACSVVTRIALWAGAIDRPDHFRRIHKGATPRLGGLGLAFGLVVAGMGGSGSAEPVKKDEPAAGSGSDAKKDEPAAGSDKKDAAPAAGSDVKKDEPAMKKDDKKPDDKKAGGW